MKSVNDSIVTLQKVEPFPVIGDIIYSLEDCLEEIEALENLSNGTRVKRKFNWEGGRMRWQIPVLYSFHPSVGKSQIDPQNPYFKKGIKLHRLQSFEIFNVEMIT